MGTIFVDNLKHQSSQGSGTITLGASGETVANSGTATYFGGTTAYVAVYNDSSQSVASGYSNDNTILMLKDCRYS